MKEKSELPSYLLDHIAWENETNTIWPAAVFILKRNLSKYNFPPKQTETALQQTLEQVKSALLTCSTLQTPLFFPAESLDAIDKEFLFEHFLCHEGFQNTLTGQGFVIDNSARFLALLNIQDHLQLQLIDSRGDWNHRNRLFHKWRLCTHE